jgi:NAD(P)-dependent dehydrogenase (short-subunit alcohol dehydrogenase family)
MNVLITGVSRGIGLALTQQALEKGHNVLGIARKAAASEQLMHIQKNSRNLLQLVPVDLADEGACAEISSVISEWACLDILINNAGIYASGNTKKDFLESFEINTIMPYLLTKSLLPKLQASKKPKLIHISSIMGSITENSSGGSEAYRSSKTALNMLNKCLSLEYKWLTSIVMHPGWVQTRMGGEGALISPEASAKGIWEVIAKIGTKESGAFFDYQGKSLSW